VPRVLSRCRARGAPRGGSLGVFLICWLPRRYSAAQVASGERERRRGTANEGEEATGTNPRELRARREPGLGRRVAAGGLGNRTLCDFYRERANFAIELWQRQWQSAKLLPGFSAWHFQRCCRRCDGVSRSAAVSGRLFSSRVTFAERSRPIPTAFRFSRRENPD